MISHYLSDQNSVFSPLLKLLTISGLYLMNVSGNSELSMMPADLLLSRLPT